MRNNIGLTSVLIVDDDADDRWLMSHAFNQICPDLQKIFVCNGEEAEQWLQSASLPIFIITDLNMPKVDGIELVQRLKHHPHYQAIPMIICTTSDSEQDRQRGYIAGANAFVTKPNQFNELANLVRCLVSVWING